MQQNIKKLNSNIENYYYSKIIDGVHYDFFQINKNKLFSNIKDRNKFKELNFKNNKWITKDSIFNLNNTVKDKIYIGIK